MKALIDTNVLLDHLAKRDGFFKDAATIFSLVEEGYLIGIVSSISIVNCSYVLLKHYEVKDVLNQIKEMLRLFTISNVDASTLEDAANLAPYDYEDAVQYLSALQHLPDVIITRDKRGFKDFHILVMTPSEFVSKAKE